MPGIFDDFFRKILDTSNPISRGNQTSSTFSGNQQDSSLRSEIENTKNLKTTNEARAIRNKSRSP